MELLRAEGSEGRERVAQARRDRERAQPAAKRRPRSPGAVWGDFVDATFVRSARKLGYNPAELWYVRERMARVGGHLLASGPQVSGGRAAALLRQQAEGMRGTPGVTQAQIDAMLKAADQAEQQQAPPPIPPGLAQNLQAVRHGRAALSDQAWARVAGVAAGVGVSDMGELPEEEVSRRLDELRQLFADALANRERPAG